MKNHLEGCTSYKFPTILGLHPQLFGKSFRFPKRLFQLYDSGFRRIGTGPLPRNRSTQVIR